jgi:hypothetical protein
MYSIPIIFFKTQSDLKGQSDLTAQQIDILPSVLQYLHFDQPYFAYGTSVFDLTSAHFAVNYLNDTYQILADNYSLNLDLIKSNSLYHYTSDTLLQHDLLASDTLRATKMELKLKAFIQNYNASLIKNSMTLSNRRN